MLSSTNVIENLIGRAHDKARRVKRWRGGLKVPPWTAAGVLEAERHFRRVKSYTSMNMLVATGRRASRARRDAEPDRNILVASLMRRREA